jgi:hypothetical protein
VWSCTINRISQIRAAGSISEGVRRAIASAAGGHVHVDTAQLGALADRYGRDAVLFDVAKRLVCKECGGKLDTRVHVPRLAKFGGRA